MITILIKQTIISRIIDQFFNKIKNSFINPNNILNVIQNNEKLKVLQTRSLSLHKDEDNLLYYLYVNVTINDFDSGGMSFHAGACSLVFKSKQDAIKYHAYILSEYKCDYEVINNAVVAYDLHAYVDFDEIIEIIEY